MPTEAVHPVVQYLQQLSMWEDSLYLVVTYVAGALMIFGGTVPYIPQYLEIRSSGNAEGFSTYVCLTLLVANTLRIMFWFGHRFELPLLIQSFMMNATMLAMVHICVAVRNKSEILTSKPRIFSETKTDTVTVERERKFSDFDRHYFWKWTDFGSYVEFLLLFTVMTGAVTYLSIDFPVYIETLGFLAVFFEALLGAPQFYRNYQNKSTKGMSVKMVMCWTCGDIFKTIYFLARSAPTQFWACGMLQVCLDVAILLQVCYYGNKAKK